MFLRLYFLLPNEELTQKVVTELTESGVKKNNIHAITRIQTTSSSLPAASKWQRMDLSQLIEKYVWQANLAIFFMAMLSLAVFLSLDMTLAAILSILVMAISFILGDLFAMFTPKIHLDEFEHALSHGEVLLMVDTLKKDCIKIENQVRKHHPAAIAGGSCWTINAMNI